MQQQTSEATDCFFTVLLAESHFSHLVDPEDITRSLTSR